MSNFFNRLFGDGSTSRDDQQQREGTYFSATDVVPTLLNNLQAKWETTNIDNGLRYTFEFQSGHFVLNTYHDERLTFLQFPFFEEAPFARLQLAREVCNDFNLQIPDYKVIYSFNTEKNLIHFHIQSGMRLSLWSDSMQADFSSLLIRTFEVARLFRSNLQNALDRDDPPEEGVVGNARERFLVNEMEMQEGFEIMRTHDTNHLMLRDLLAIVKGYDVETISVVRVVADSAPEAMSFIRERKRCGAEVDSTDDFDITNVLFHVTSAEEVFLSTRNLSLYIDVIDKAHYQKLLIYMTLQDEVEGVYYYRIDVLNIDQGLNPGHSLDVRNTDDERHVSLLMSFRPTVDEAKESEFEYAYKEAQAKMANGKGLTDEEEFMMLSHDHNTAADLYWGVHYYLARNYYQALQHLENSYKALVPNFHTLSKSERGRYFELCYYIGVCYLRLERPKMAYYYLDSLYNLNNIKYTRAYVIALVKSRDYRAFNIINSVLSNIQRLLREDSEPKEAMRENLENFVLFLRRSKANVLSDMNRLEEAERELRSLLNDDKAHETYLLRLLTNVVNRRAEQSESPDSETRSVTSEFPKVAPSDAPGGAASDEIE